MVKPTFLDLAKRVLTQEGRALSPSEIWKIAVAKGYTSTLDFVGKTPAHSLYSAIFLDARDNPESAFFKIGARPARYFLKSLAAETKPSDLEKAAAAEASVPEVFSFDESDLHKFLAYFCLVHFKAYTKTIRHLTSTKKEFGE
jgi:uncharacterized protein